MQHVRHLPDIIHLQQMLIDRFNRRVDVNEAKKTTIEEFLNELQSAPEGNGAFLVYKLI